MTGKAKMTKARRDFLKLATRTASGNPWFLVGIRKRAGKARMFAEMQAEGLFGPDNCITRAGRAALAAAEEGR